MVDEQIYLENILNITNYIGQNIKIVNNKIYYISEIKKQEDFSKSDNIYNVLLDSYSYFFNKYTYSTIDKNLLKDIKTSLKGIKRFSEDNFKIRPLYDYIEIEIINFLSSNNEIDKSNYENKSTFSNDNSDNEKIDDDFCIIDINVDDNLHKRKNINTIINTTKNDSISNTTKNDSISNTTKNDSISNNDKKTLNTKKQSDKSITTINNVNININDTSSNEEKFEDNNISEKIQKFLSVSTGKICRFCSNQDNSKHIHSIDDDKKESFSYKLKNICNDIKKSLRSISFNDCFSGLTCICCSKIEEDDELNNNDIR
jgi:hypothetical protein